MSTSYIPDHVKFRLWGLAAGRCQYQGCNRALWLDDITKAEFNRAYLAHIVADKPDGPRGHPVLSEQLKAQISNLMLLCDPHHRLVDIADVGGYPVERLHSMKATHEDRIVRLGVIACDRQSEVLLYGANIGDNVRLPTFAEAASAMLPEWYPARDRPTSMSLVNSWSQDHETNFWTSEAEHLRRAFDAEVRPRLRDTAPPHFSVFALAPQPLLMCLGRMLTDLVAVEVYQRHREPTTWAWPSQDERESVEIQPLIIERPTNYEGTPALVLSLSATITDERVFKVLGPAASIWRVRIERPNNDYLKIRDQLIEFRENVRGLLDEIKARHGQQAQLHVFPAAPAAACVELGRVIMPKADLTLRVYDENKSLGGFVYALDINSPAGA